MEHTLIKRLITIKYRWIMKKKIFFAAVTLAALASCTSDDFVGEKTSPETSNTPGAIQFASDAGKVTRATANTGTVAEMLDGQFKVYGVKNVKNASNQDVYSTVFPSYVAWNNSSLNATNSNPDAGDDSKGWEYVGPTSTTYGAASTPLVSEQTIKYWDYSAANYHFAAGSPVANFTFHTSDNDINSVDVIGLAGHIIPNSGTAITTNPVYIAEPVNVLPADYKKPVTFNFVRQQARVRVGIYETIPGYVIKEIKFYNHLGSPETTYPNNVILSSATENYFTGATEGTATVTYDWATPTYTFAYSTGLTRAQDWYGGKFLSTEPTDPTKPAVPAITSTAGANLFGSDNDMSSTDYYFTVLPTTSGTAAAPMILKCDYVLLSEKDGSGETITITGATAAIPAAFSKWEPNTSYTYLFKISDNTNGYTGTSSQPSGLYPITFDAVIVTEATGTEQGTITTVSTPSITTYQTGSVTTTGIEYKTGTPINLTVQNNTTGSEMILYDGGADIGGVQVYKLNAAIDASPAPTEADMQISAPSGTDLFVLGSTNTTVSVTISGTTYQTVSLTADKYGYFTPTEAGFYAIQYLTTKAVADPATPAAYTYKIIKVASGS